MNGLGLNFLKWMQENRTPGGEEFFLRLTEWGEGFWLMSVLGILFWVFGARWAYRVGLALVAGDLLTSVVKNALCIPRPWVRDPEILPVAAAQRGAFGYSLPSGHASSLALLWGGLAAALRRWWVWLPVLGWIGLAGFSRVYLGVHTPVDVAASWLLAIPVVWAAGWAVGRVERDPARAWQVLGGAALLAVAAGVIMYYRPVPEDADAARFGRDTYRAMAALLAFLAAWHIERTYIRYEPAKLGAYRILAVAVGMLVISLMLNNLRRLVAPWLGENGSLYFVAAAGPFWIFVIWPFLLQGLEKPAPR
jgi:membrane-associated phospholipid phosphatase